MKQLTGHIQRVRYSIESNEETPGSVYKITALMRCDKLLVARLLSKQVSADYHNQAAILGLATMLEKKTKKHLKECKTCRIARKKMRSR